MLAIFFFFFFFLGRSNSNICSQQNNSYLESLANSFYFGVNLPCCSVQMVTLYARVANPGSTIGALLVDMSLAISDA